MDNGAILEERLRYQKFIEEEWIPALEKFLQRYMPNGKLEKVGQTAECLYLQEFYDYVDNKVRKETRERYETHFSRCEDCARIIPQLQGYLAQTRSSSRIAILSREANALYCRIKDYLTEQKEQI